MKLKFANFILLLDLNNNTSREIVQNLEFLNQCLKLLP